MTSLSSWLDTKLSEVLGFPATEEITGYILSMESLRDQEAYLTEMLDSNNPQHVALVQEFKKRRQRSDPAEALADLGTGVRAYRKPQDPEPAHTSKKDKAKGQNKQVAPTTDKVEPAPSSAAPEQKRTKSHFVPLYSSDGSVTADSVMLSGRRTCECQSAKHKLINNCLSCGRVVCAQEGSGPCLFCGALVCTREEQEVLDRGSKKSEQLMKKLMGGTKAASEEEALRKAEAHRNMLLEFDRTSEKRTQVIDDESDYFSVDATKWLSKEQREKIEKLQKDIDAKKNVSRKDRKITFDFAGRRVVEDESDTTKYDAAQDVQKILDGGNKNKAKDLTDDGIKRVLDDSDGLVNPFIGVPRPLFIESESADAVDSKKAAATWSSKVSGGGRLQDRELQELSDSGVCLSMHQPYASLLVCGLKRHEGRTWYSAHRGRLWIHAAAKEPSSEESKEVIEFYRSLQRLQGGSKVFPSAYPTSCLLGFVDVVDCLSQEDYRERFPDGESSSPYVFICQNPNELLVKFPMSGQHKIYKLDPNIHRTAQKAAKKK